VPVLKGLWNPFHERRLVEPFVGGLAVALGLRPRRALLNDVNPHLINFYSWLQRGLTVSETLLNDRDAYYRARKRFNELILAGKADSEEAAVWFYYLNRTGFNGLCRFNRSGEYNVPFGSYKTVNYVTDFGQYKDSLENWVFSCGDFSEVRVEAGDFVYADPPYDSAFASYSSGGFGWNEQVRLAEWLAQLDGPVVASNHATVRIIELYSSLGFELRAIVAPRRISSNGDRTPAQELIALKGLGEAGRVLEDLPRAIVNKL